MFDMSWGEVMLIGGVALVVIGPKDLPKALRTMGQVTGKLRRMAGEFRMQFDEAIREAELDEVRESVRKAGTGFNPVQTIRDEIKGAVEGRAKPEVGPPAAPAAAERVEVAEGSAAPAGSGGGAYDVPLPVPGSIDDPFGPSPEPARAPPPAEAAPPAARPDYPPHTKTA